MRTLLVFLLCCCTSLSYGSAKKDKLFARIYALDKALIERDSNALKTILHDSVSYGHSNGWIETKKEVIADLFNGKLVYKDIKNGSKLEVDFLKNTATVRLSIIVKVVVEGNEMELKLQVLEVWRWKKGDWKLMARQSVKMDK